MADELGALIASGTKHGSLLSALGVRSRKRNFAQGWLENHRSRRNGNPLCIVEMTEVEVVPYDRVDARFAYEEGERSLAYWRDAH